MSLKQTLKTNGYESVHLDEIVHDAASRLATAANNDGMKSQISFLTDTCCWSESKVEKALDSCSDDNQ